MNIPPEIIYPVVALILGAAIVYGVLRERRKSAADHTVSPVATTQIFVSDPEAAEDRFLTPPGSVVERPETRH
jgi:hypothetical protein